MLVGDWIRNEIGDVIWAHGWNNGIVGDGGIGASQNSIIS